MPEITLEIRKERSTLTAKEAEEIKAQWETEMAGDGVTVKNLDLGCRQWSAEAIPVLKPILEKVSPNIVVLNIEDTIAGLQTDLGFEIMEEFTDIFKNAKQVVELHMDDNATGPRVLQRIAPLLGSPNLKKLHFNNCGLSAETVPMLDEAMMVTGTGPGIARLESLWLDRNMMGAEGAQAFGKILATCVNLTGFSYMGNRPGPEATGYLAASLKKLVENHPDAVNPMKELKLADCSFDGKDIDGNYTVLEDLGKALEKMSMLTHLNLEGVGELEETGTGIVAQALITSKCPLVDLDYSACGLTLDGADAMAELLREKLDTLKVLKLESDELENDGVEKILAAFEGENCLERLHLDQNELDEGAIGLLLDAHLPKLRVLSLKDNMDLEEADDEKKEELRKKFPNATILIADDDEEPAAEVTEKPDADVDALADELAELCSK